MSDGDTVGGDGTGRDGTDAPPTAESAFPPPPPRPPRNRFFDWIRGLGLVRTPGWIGGVSAGLGARLGIDPILVRGILVVLAVLGAPVVLLYAAAWLLLPDEHDVIHAEELGRGRFDPAIAGIGGLVLLSLLPLNQGFWNLGALYWGGPQLDFPFGRVFWTAVLIAAVVFFVIWVARRSSDDTTKPAAQPAPATEAAPAAAAAPAPAPADSPPTAYGATATVTGDRSGIAPQPPSVDASADELAAWRRQQDEWQRQRAAWAAEQKRTDRELAQAAAREKARLNAEAAIERARIRRITNPPISGAFVILTIGLAIVAGALAALLWPNAGRYDATVGWAAAVFVLGAAIAVAGALRRRSGFLTFLSIVSLLILLATTALPSGRQFIFPGSSHGIDTTVSGQYAQPAGDIQLIVWNDDTEEVTEIDLWQGAGHVSVWVEPGQTVRVDATTEGHDVQLLTRAPDGSEILSTDTIAYRAEDDRFASTTTAGADGDPDVIVTLWQGNGTVQITELPE
jgi:phage shock protein PspC (stress-responsive transcriptional regulator)